ncbi:tRNA (cytidine(34)-2'-O)-methyltransferase [Prochlorococcus marinus]|uniref:Putative tRNA (cytidine(34)-2'-O)-methyltransferase n=1 Tax=Prochlorococcus marinus (strain MIT 9211) TaxID=93059 RepID=A9BAH1_PROM4|nr:tRNA (cytidine(34)-2'-O)-methyltransferase [Prochlorococcus marinus]ABX08833.1 putative tRNA/rRNA methyltransferase (SpoU family) [Prochlorococcus marinus str. MIT 9211]
MNVKPHHLKVALFEPRIPQNTGNIGRTCAAFQIPLHLIKPLGFSLDSKLLKRAGLDYWDFIDLTTHENFSAFKIHISDKRLIGFSKKDGIPLNKITFKPEDVLLFGREDTGLPEDIREACDLMVSIPMPGKADSDGSNGVRSLNLSSACAIASYSALVDQLS